MSNRGRGGRRSRNARNRRNRRRRVNIFGPVFNSLQTSVIRLCQSVSLTTNGSGTLAALIYNDPYSASFTEYTSDFCNIYNQFRLLGSRIQFVSTIETKGDTTVVGIGYQNRNTGLGTPTGINLVLDNQPSQLWAISSDTSPHGFVMQQRMTNLMFAPTSTTSNTSTDSQGAPGGWQIYGSLLPNSTVVAFCKQEVFLEFRSRS
jgi:hypothetical protein